MINELSCYICNKQDQEGIIIKEQYICRECEKEIVSTQPGEEKYEEYKEKIKEILFE
ncbi:sigma factor G inhibitor Gin [Alkaliphilus transvaalensis]|uniref:sigma factor G inhibitor Gin n=1 Tax=Alkaliphilus transvaalensis TaxID=114628 RepID=UPI000A02E3F9|nr:sigma factor G inhibitor Gin [Alkaliphilus transvaalensis]